MDAAGCGKRYAFPTTLDALARTHSDHRYYCCYNCFWDPLLSQVSMESGQIQTVWAIWLVILNFWEVERTEVLSACS